MFSILPQRNDFRKVKLSREKKTRFSIDFFFQKVYKDAVSIKGDVNNFFLPFRKESCSHRLFCFCRVFN